MLAVKSGTQLQSLSKWDSKVLEAAPCLGDCIIFAMKSLHLPSKKNTKVWEAALISIWDTELFSLRSGF